MKKSIIAFSLFILFSSFGYSQNSINGQVVDDKNQPIFYATVALYAQADSSMIGAESTDDKGNFEFKKLDEGAYYLEVSMLGYADEKIAEIIIPREDANFQIAMSTDAALLSTIEIKDKLPLLEQKADKLIVNVENNMTNTAGSLLDVMKKVPGMLVINDRLTMAGSGSPTILINGKSTQYMDVQSLLQDMPGDNIKKVEIIHQPGAEYEAAGSGPILNIILKKNSLFGTNGTISVGVGKGELWDHTTALNLSHYAGDFNVSGGLGYSRNAWVETLELERRLTNIGSDIDGSYIQKNREAATPNTYRGNLRMDWDMTSKHRLGLETKYYNNNNDYVATNVTNIDLLSANATDYTLNTDNDQNRGWTYSAINPYYIFEIDTMGQKIELDFNTARFKIDNMNTLSTVSTLDTNTVSRQRYIQPGDTKIYATKLDYTKPLNKIFELKVGAKYSFADLDNDLQSSNLSADSVWVNNTNQSNHYLFEEKIYAAYTKLGWTSGSWSGTAGLRYENSKSIGTSLTVNSSLDRTISQLFPSASVSRKINEAISASVAYSYRIDRPRYSTLNPFVYYIDPFTFESGNPNIRPELTHSSKFTLTYEGQPFFNVEYKKSNNAIVEVTQQEPDSEEASKTDVNFDNQTNFSTMLILPLEFIPGISGYIGGIATNNSYDSRYNDGDFERSKWSATSFIQIEFKIPGDINAELGGWYNSGEQEGIFNSEHIYGTSFGMSKKFLNDKAKISVGVEDFVNRFWHANVDYQQDMDLKVSWQAPVVNAKFSYKFGNQHLKSKERLEGSASEELRRASSGN